MGNSRLPMNHNPWMMMTLTTTATLIASLAALMYTYTSTNKKFRRRQEDDRTKRCAGYEALIGNTPLVKLEKLSKILKRNVYVKMEHMNPGGTGKDRAALAMIDQAERRNLLPRGGGGIVVEGTSGSTGIALAALCNTRGHECVIVMPDDQAVEKQQLLRYLGAKVEVVPTASISNPKHYVNMARRYAKRECDGGKFAFFTDQFENEANMLAHYTTTGPEIWEQTCHEVDCFVMSSGTGGTISGVGMYLKEQKRSIKVVLVDPPGSCLYNKVKHGVAYTSEQRERSLRRHRYDTIAEGIGLDRVTHNFSIGLNCDTIDDAIFIEDQEAVDMAHWLLKEEGFFVGSSSAMNLVGAVKISQQLPENSTIVTVFCDSGQRHVSRFWSEKFIEERNLQWPHGDVNIANFLQPVT